MTSSATGDNSRTSILIVAVIAIKAAALTSVNNSPARGDIVPDGISRFTVRGLAASIFRSRYLLKPMAVLRANIIERSILMNIPQSNGYAWMVVARKNPIIAKGSANIVCAKVTSEK